VWRLIAVGVLTAAAVAVVAPALADGEHEVIFRTPSGNIRCDGWAQVAVPDRAGLDNTVSCALMSSKSGDGYPAGAPDVYTLNANGAAEVSRRYWRIAGPYQVLAYGHTLRLHYINCTSRSIGLRCVSSRSGHGFFLSRERQDTF
jgi:hypothetical protein